MALAFLNRCGFRAASSGTGSFVVASALTGMQTPAQAAGPAVVNAATYRYFAQSDDLTQWEYGTGVYTTGDTTLTRATIYDNSSGGTTALSFSAAPQVRMGGPLAQDMGQSLIAAGSFTAEDFLEIDLPSIYSHFKLELFDVVTSSASADPLSFAFSANGGSTYLHDEDEYLYGYLRTGIGSGSAEGSSAGDFLGIIDAEVQGSSDVLHVTMDIYPGETGKSANVRCSNVHVSSTVPLPSIYTNVNTTTGRMNRIGILMYGNADAPPTGTETITGTYRLYGYI